MTFKDFEAAGWSARATTYDALMARATALAVEPLLDAAGVGSGVRVLDVGCGLGALAAAAALNVPSPQPTSSTRTPGPTRAASSNGSTASNVARAISAS